MPSTHDQMIKCDWTCGALRIRAEASPSQAVVTNAASASQEGARSQPIRSGGWPGARSPSAVARSDQRKSCTK